jgi:hypothetical protein
MMLCVHGVSLVSSGCFCTELDIPGSGVMVLHSTFLQSLLINVFIQLMAISVPHYVMISSLSLFLVVNQ